MRNNRQWACEKRIQDPAYFEKLSLGQQPKALLIACSDSRVSPSLVMGGDLGDLFVHRNIANIVSHADLNLLSVMQYAIEVLGIKHIIIKGHYGCGGVKAAMNNDAIGLIDNWLANIKDVVTAHQEELDAIADESARFNRLVELNVITQLRNVQNSSVYRKAVRDGKELHLHGWVYDFSSGMINVLTPEEGLVPWLVALEEEFTCGCDTAHA